MSKGETKMGKKFLNRLGFKITNEFLKRNNFNKYNCDPGLKVIFTLIKSYCNDVLKMPWMGGNVLKLPYTLNVINPASLLLKEDGYEDGMVEFYCHSSLSKIELDRMAHLLSNSIEEFIERHRTGLQEYNPTIKLDNIIINPQLQGKVDTPYLSENLTLIKVLFIRELANKAIFIGTSKNEKYIQEGREIIFYPSYSKQDGHILISEIINIETADKLERMAYFITPNIEIRNGEIFVYPIIGIKRFVSYKRMEAIQYGAAEKYSILIFDGYTYHSPRINYKENKEIKMVSEDWKLFKYIEEFKGVSFGDISNYILGADVPNIHLVYSNKSGVSHNLNAGVPGCDKIDIYNYILDNIKGLEPLEAVEEIKIKKHAGGLTNTDRIILPQTIYRSNKMKINLLVIHPPESTLYQDLLNVIEEGKLINKHIGFAKGGDGSYSLEVSGSKIIDLSVRSIPSIAGLEIKAENETAEERLNKLRDDIGENISDNLNLAFIDLGYMGKYDSKAIIRKALDSCGIVNQFIDSKTGITLNKIASGLRDLFNDVGLGNSNQTISDSEVIYTLHKVNKVNFICRLDNNTVEIKVPGVTDSYLHVTDIYPILSSIKYKINSIGNIDSIAIATFLQDLAQEQREVIVILENGEKQYNNVIGNLESETIEKIKLYSKEYVTTDLLGHQEVVQTKDNKITLGAGNYRVDNGIYISIGDKGQDRTTVEASKIRTWINKINKQSIGAKIAFKDRIAYEMCFHKNKDNDALCMVIHNLRLATTTHSHLNRCITTDYILGFEKHLWEGLVPLRYSVSGRNSSCEVEK